MLMIIFNFLKSKYGLLFIVLILTILSFFYIYNKGFSRGIEQEKAKAAIEYSIALEKALKDREEKQKKAIEEAVKLNEAKKKTEIIYKEKIVTIEKLIENNKNLTSEVCKLNEEEYKQFKESLEAIK